MTELEFLKTKGLIKEGFTKFVISGDFGEIELTELLKEYHNEQLRIGGVVGRSEQLKTIPPNECEQCGVLINHRLNKCGDCGL